MELFLFFKLRERVEYLEAKVEKLQQQISELDLELQMMKLKEEGRE